MKHYMKVLIGILFFVSLSYTQCIWQWQNPSLGNTSLLDICFIDSLRGWAVGGAGMVLNTTDGGQQWRSTQVPIHEMLFRVTFVDSNYGWVMTYYTEKVLRTTDGGITWDSISTLPWTYYLDIHFVNESMGFASGGNGTIVRTIDGGITWNFTNTNTYGAIESLHFTSELIGWAACSDRYTLRTTDGGLTWNKLSMPGIEPSSRSVFSLDDQRAYVVGGHEFYGTVTGFLYSTTNGGNTWQEKYFNQILSDVYFSSSLTGWVCDIDGKIFHTSDGGATWTQLNSSASQFVFADSNRAWTVTGSSIIVATNDGWQTCHSQTQSITTQSLYAVSAFDSNRVAACGTGSIIIGSKDGGINWSQYYNSNSQIYLNDILYKSTNEIWAVGQGGTILHSTNDGTNWSDTTIGNVWFNGIAFVNDSIGYIVGGIGDVYRTNDAGSTWIQHTTGINTSINRVVFSNASLGWIAGDDGVYRSTDAGQTWQHVFTSIFHFDIAVIGDCAWFPVVNSVLYTTDAGSTWATTTVFPVDNIIYSIKSLAFTDRNNGWAASENGRIYRTTNGGESWYMESDICGSSLYGIRFTNSNRGWAVGGNGAILHFNNLLTSVSDYYNSETPKRVALQQNYPNPFNPTTTIAFTLQHISKVSLKIFDILGRELVTLFSGELKPGTFSVLWNAQQVSSGVYFYRLQTDNYVETKRMLILK